MPEEIRIVSGNGTIHKAFVSEGVIFTAEGDNIDQADVTAIHGKDEPDGSRSFALPGHASVTCERCLGTT